MNQTRQQAKLGQVGQVAPYLTLALLLVATLTPAGQRLPAQAGGSMLPLTAAAGLAGPASPSALRAVAQASLTLACSGQLLAALSGVDTPCCCVIATSAPTAGVRSAAWRAGSALALHTLWTPRAIPVRAP